MSIALFASRLRLASISAPLANAFFRPSSFIGRWSVWIRAKVGVPSDGFHYDTGQCIGCGICNEDEVEALRVSARDRDRAGQIYESPTDAARTKRIRKSR